MLYKRGRKWWVRFTARGREIRVTSGTDRRDLAEEFEQRLREAIWREKALGQEVHTWEEACDRWFQEKSGKRSIERDHQAVAKLGLTGVLDDVRQVDRGKAREWATARSILNAAVGWGWLDKAPRIKINAPPKQDPRWITGEQFDALVAELPTHARPIACFAVFTGARSANVFRLKWEDVDLERGVFRVVATEAKGGKSLGIALSKNAQKVLSRQRGKHAIYVFTDQRGRAPIRSIKTTWTKAVKRAGLEGFRFHDLRHTWAAWHVLNGTPPIQLKELGGWQSLAMVERYGALNPAHLAEWAGNARPYRSRHSGAVMRLKRKKTRRPK